LIFVDLELENRILFSGRGDRKAMVIRTVSGKTTLYTQVFVRVLFSVSVGVY